MRSTNESVSRQATSRSSRRKVPLHKLNRNRGRSVAEYRKKRPTGSSGNLQKGSTPAPTGLTLPGFYRAGAFSPLLLRLSGNHAIFFQYAKRSSRAQHRRQTLQTPPFLLPPSDTQGSKGPPRQVSCAATRNQSSRRKDRGSRSLPGRAGSRQPCIPRHHQTKRGHVPNRRSP